MRFFFWQWQNFMGVAQRACYCSTDYCNGESNSAYGPTLGTGTNRFLITAILVLVHLMESIFRSYWEYLI